MTAEIVIMNREAAVLAADSAVSLNNGSKILKTANKVFNLIPGCPVGVLIYSNSTFMNVPWEILIKEFRDYSSSFGGNLPYLEDYGLRFFSFIEENYSKFVTPNQEYHYFMNCAYLEFQSIAQSIWEEIRQVYYIGSQISEDQIQNITTKKVSDNLNYWKNGEDILTTEISKSLYEKIERQFAKEIPDLIKQVFEKLPISPDLEQMLSDIAYFAVTRIGKGGNHTHFYSGIVFAGYGKEDLYPIWVNYEVFGLLCGVLIYRKKDRCQVGFTNDCCLSSIKPFAQEDVMHHILSGVLPQYIDLLFNLLCAKYDQNEVEEIFDHARQIAQEKYTQPILDTISLLPKDELASVARTLVDLTSFIRHVSPEAESVGGPVDVAVISKKDGFIWIDRKHYFDKEKNLNYLNIR